MLKRRKFVLNLFLLYAAHLQQRLDALSEDADILLYGCQIAAQEDVGKTKQAVDRRKPNNSISPFVHRLHQLIGVNISASANPTGSLALGGDWDLEVRTGTTQPPLAFPPAVRVAYRSTFALSEGDLAVIGYNTDEPNPNAGVTTTDFSFTMIALDDVAAGKTIKITDRGWNSTANALTTNSFSDGPPVSLEGIVIEAGVNAQVSATVQS